MTSTLVLFVGAAGCGAPYGPGPGPVSGGELVVPSDGREELGLRKPTGGVMTFMTGGAS